MQIKKHKKNKKKKKIDGDKEFSGVELDELEKKKEILKKKLQKEDEKEGKGIYRLVEFLWHYSQHDLDLRFLKRTSTMSAYNYC